MTNSLNSCRCLMSALVMIGCTAIPFPSGVSYTRDTILWNSGARPSRGSVTIFAEKGRRERFAGIGRLLAAKEGLARCKSRIRPDSRESRALQDPLNISGLVKAANTDAKRVRIEDAVNFSLRHAAS